MHAGSSHVVTTEATELFTPADPLALVCGDVLDTVTVAWESYGELNADASNAVFVCHALTGDAHASGLHEDAHKAGWWDNLIGPGKPLDTTRWFVVCANLLGGCQGTTGPSSVNPATGEPWGINFPLLAMSDFVAVHRRLGRHLGIERWAVLLGGSLGGMQVLEWTLTYPEEVGRAVIIAASSRLTAQNIAFSAVGRQAILRDPDRSDGLAVARMMAHITYLSETAFSEKFGRASQHDQPRRGFGVDFAVEGYLDHQGESFLARFDALSYLYLTRVMDYFDPFASPDALAGVAAERPRCLVMSFDTDWRFSTEHSRRIVRHLEGAGVPVTFREISSVWGHDSFLLAIPEYHDTLRAFLTQAAEEAGV